MKNIVAIGGGHGLSTILRSIKDVKDVTVQVIENNKNNELVAYVVSHNKNIKKNNNLNFKPILIIYK